MSNYDNDLLSTIRGITKDSSDQLDASISVIFKLQDSMEEKIKYIFISQKGKIIIEYKYTRENEKTNHSFNLNIY